MTNDLSVNELGAWSEEYSFTILSANTSFQLARAPWPSPVGKKMILEQITITPQSVGSLGAQLIVWDQDLSNSTPPTRGSAGGALLIFGASAAAVSGATAQSTLLSEHQTPEKEFVGGFAMQSSVVNVNVSAVFKIK